MEFALDSAMAILRAWILKQCSTKKPCSTKNRAPRQIPPIVNAHVETCPGKRSKISFPAEQPADFQTFESLCFLQLLVT